MLLLKLIYKKSLLLNEVFTADKRTTVYPGLGEPWIMISAIVLYLLIVLKWGPRFMAQRKPYKVDGLMKIFNVVQILLNLAMFCEGLRYSYWRSDFSFTCERYDPNDRRPETMKLIRPVLLYYFSKYLDMFDTIFFLLRKKYNQISFLHVYHHAMMIFGVYLYGSFFFASHVTATGVVNSFIHVVMYTYYLLAAMKPKYNWQPWKKALTCMQLLQFAYLGIHYTMPLINNWCKVELPFIVASLMQNLFMIALFSNFYYNAYIVKDRKHKNNAKSTM